MKNEFVVSVGKIYFKQYSYVSDHDDNFLINSYNNASSVSKWKIQVSHLKTKLMQDQHGRFIELFSGLPVDIIDYFGYLEDGIEKHGTMVCNVENGDNILKRSATVLYVLKGDIQEYNEKFDKSLLRSSKHRRKIKEVLYYEQHRGMFSHESAREQAILDIRKKKILKKQN